MADADSPRHRGTVTYFHRVALYGFVQREDGEVYYLPASAVKTAGLTLKIGDVLEFASLPPGGKPRAVNLALIARGR
jgi:cold shock CspA family protein